MIAKQLAESFRLKNFELSKKMEILKDFFHLNYNHKKGVGMKDLNSKKDTSRGNF